jgi:branched-subunit amino acid aminotransferase/4-amino-4-deoxychorismate lyase
VVIAQAAQAGIHVVERKVALDETRRVDEAFITSSVLGVMPVSRLLEKELPIPGEVTARLMRLYARAAD